MCAGSAVATAGDYTTVLLPHAMLCRGGAGPYICVASPQELLEQANSLQKEAKNCLQSLPDSAPQMREMLERCGALGVQLPEAEQLARHLRQGQWLSRVQAALVAGHPGTLQEMRSLLQEAGEVAESPAVEKACSELKELISIALRWEAKAQMCLEAR